MRITSIRERPEYIPALLTSLEEHWPACMPWIKKHMEQVLRTGGPMPDAYIAVEGDKVVGGYTLAYKEILWSQDTGLWIATLYMAPAFRGRHLSPVLIDHARRRGWELGEEKIYLASEHTNYYEKFGFHTIGPDACAWGEPTQMFEADTLPPRPACPPPDPSEKTDPAPRPSRPGGFLRRPLGKHANPPGGREARLCEVFGCLPGGNTV